MYIKKGGKMPEWTMKVINPTDNFNIETVTLRVKEEEEKKRIKVGIKIIAPVPYTDDTYRSHHFKITRIISASKRKGEIEHLGIVFERMEITPAIIKEVDDEIGYLAKYDPDSIAEFCPHCYTEIIPKNFVESIFCPICGKPYNLPF